MSLKPLDYGWPVLPHNNRSGKDHSIMFSELLLSLQIWISLLNKSHSFKYMAINADSNLIAWGGQTIMYFMLSLSNSPLEEETDFWLRKRKMINEINCHYDWKWWRLYSSEISKDMLITGYIWKGCDCHSLTCRRRSECKMQMSSKIKNVPPIHLQTFQLPWIQIIVSNVYFRS